MVRDGYYYGAVLIAAAGLVAWLTRPSWAIVPLVLAGFFLWFFRDPERVIPSEPGIVVSPADGTVTSIAPVVGTDRNYTRISNFPHVSNVHLNRSSVARG